MMPNEDDEDCNTDVSKWYYNKAEGTCVNFMYGECPAGQNIFDTIDSCNAVCKAHNDLYDLHALHVFHPLKVDLVDHGIRDPTRKGQGKKMRQALAVSPRKGLGQVDGDQGKVHTGVLRNPIGHRRDHRKNGQDHLRKNQVLEAVVRE
ncbi:hypothetical protein MRX96_015597 [Rhipicephalus microplus]